MERLKKHLNNDGDFCFTKDDAKKEVDLILEALQNFYILEGCCIDGTDYYFLIKNKYYIVDVQCGDVIKEVYTLNEAHQVIKEIERQDQESNFYIPDSYIIKDRHGDIVE